VVLQSNRRRIELNILSSSRPRIAGKNTITLKDRSMITVAPLASQGRNEELETHLKGASHLGISKEQLLEIMIHVAHYAGWPAGNNGQRIALKVFEQKEARTHLAEREAS
jgi:4-carboxymuconolactone decarboxylase